MIKKSTSAQTTQKLIHAYQKLNPDEKLVMQIICVPCRNITDDQLTSIVKALKWKNFQGKPLLDILKKGLPAGLKKSGLITVSRRELRCSPAIKEIPVRELVLNGKYAQVKEASEKIFSKNYFWDFRSDAFSEFCELRHALYSGNDKEVLSMIGAARSPWTAHHYDQAQDLIKLCLHPVDPDWTEWLPRVILYQALGTVLNIGIINLQHDPVALDQARKHFPAMAQSSREPLRTLAQLLMVRGQLQEAEKILKDDNTGQGLGLKASLNLIYGNHARAYEDFALALRVLKKQTRKRLVHFNGLASLFYILAALARGDSEAHELIQKQIDIKRRAKQYDIFANSFEMLADISLILMGKMQFKDSELMRFVFSNQKWPYMILLQTLGLYWAGRKPDPKNIKTLTACFSNAHKKGFNWYAREAALILDKFGQKDSLSTLKKSPELEKWTSITELVKPVPEWELALTALQNLSAGKSPSPKNDQDKNQRMVWRLIPVGDTYQLEPREQNITKSGTWTKGRPVALKRLFESPEEFGCLTEHDLKLCRAVKMDTYSVFYRRYSKTEYSLLGDSALTAAAGHPLIFREDDPHQPVELILENPVLHVLTEKDAIRLFMEPKPAQYHSVLPIEEHRHRIRLVKFSDEHRQLSEITGPQGLKVPLTAKQRVMESIAEIAPLLSVHSDIEGKGQTKARKVRTDPRPLLRLYPAGQGIGIDLLVRPVSGGSLIVRPGEGGKTLFAEINGSQVFTKRDLDAEVKSARAVIEKCPALDPDSSWSWRVDDLETALETLLQLQELGDEVILEWPEGKPVKVSRETSASSMKANVKSQQDWFSLHGELHLDDGRVLDMAQLLSLMEKSPGRFVRLEQGDFLSLTRDFRNRLESIRGYSNSGKFHSLAAPVMEEVLSEMDLKPASSWVEHLKKLNQAGDYDPDIPSTLRAELRHYQAEGFKWLARLAHWGAGACLADDMGLGKTIQALALILLRAPQGPTLVLAPTSVCVNWLEETARFAPTLNPVRFGPGDREQMISRAGPFDLIVCSYGLMQNEANLLSSIKWTTIIADEAQAIKNFFTKRSRAAMSLPGDYKMITTGTPIENHLGELWNLFNFISPGLLGSLESFNRRFAHPIEQYQDNEARIRLKKLIRPFVLRRLKSEVLTELPSRTEVTIKIELSPEEAALYEAIRRKALESMSLPEAHPGQKRIRMLAEIMRLRRACCHPELVMSGNGKTSSKLQAFGEILDDLLENRHQALVFSQFVDHLRLTREYIDKRGVKYQYLDGSTPAAKRHEAVNAFQAGEGNLFLISLKAGGFGLNLTAADYVIHLDPWWNPAVEDQASDRAHRIGQKRPVTIYRLVTQNTIEEKILDLHIHKRDLATSLLEGTDTGARLSLEDMMDLVREQHE